jgi:hypothetical protein
VIEGRGDGAEDALEFHKTENGSGVETTPERLANLLRDKSHDQRIKRERFD